MIRPSEGQSMATSEKVTITLPESLVQRLLDDLDREFGTPSEEDRKWAERVMAGDPSVLHPTSGQPTKPSGEDSEE